MSKANEPVNGEPEENFLHDAISDGTVHHGSTFGHHEDSAKKNCVPADSCDDIAFREGSEQKAIEAQKKNMLKRFSQWLIPYGGVVSNCFSLGSVTLGGGIISMPSSFAMSGIVMSVIYLVVITTITVYTMTLMGYAMEKTGVYTFEELARVLFGRGWDYFVGFYFDFADDTKDSILENFDPVHQPYMMVAYIGMLVKLCAAYAMNMVPCRGFIYHCLRWNIETLPYWKHILVVLAMSVIVLLCGLFIPSINTALGLVGSLCGGFIGFIFPAYYWMYCGDWSIKTVGLWHWLATYFLLVAGVIAIVFGTIATVYFSFVV
ncbi:Transmembrane amino acid transporter protein [Lotmaria passim]